jgi:hypothetical protein
MTRVSKHTNKNGDGATDTGDKAMTQVVIIMMMTVLGKQ